MVQVGQTAKTTKKYNGGSIKVDQIEEENKKEVPVQTVAIKELPKEEGKLSLM
jgi:hypothetical protein